MALTTKLFGSSLNIQMEEDDGDSERDSSVNAIEVTQFRIQPDSEDMSFSVSSPPSNSNFPSLESDSDSGLGSRLDSDARLIDFFNPEVYAVDTDILLNPNQRLSTTGDLNIWGFHDPKENIDLGLRIGVGSADSGWLGLRVTGIDGVLDQRIHEAALDNGNRESNSVDAMVVDGELSSTSRISSRDDQDQFLERQASIVVNNFNPLLEEFSDNMINHSDIDHEFDMINHSDINHEFDMINHSDIDHDFIIMINPGDVENDFNIMINPSDIDHEFNMINPSDIDHEFNMINHSDIDHEFNMINHIDIDHEFNMFLSNVGELFEMFEDYDPISGEMFDNEPEIMGSSPASKKVVEDLPVVNLTMEILNKSGGIFCAICKDEIEIKENVRKLPCSHYYHGNCILPWLEIRNTCPVCRYELPTDDM